MVLGRYSVFGSFDLLATARGHQGRFGDDMKQVEGQYRACVGL